MTSSSTEKVDGKRRKFALPSTAPAPLILIDSREQLPWEFPFRTEITALPTGDYTVLGLEERVCVERKSLSDFLGCCGQERDRFSRELQRLRAFESPLVVIETSWEEIEAANWRSRLNSNQVRNSLLGWMSGGVPFMLPGTRERAQFLVIEWLRVVHKRAWRKLRSLAG